MAIGLRVLHRPMMAAALAVATLTIASGLQIAGAQSPPDDADAYGAIAYNERTGRYGWSINYKSQDEANDRALDECGRGCRVVMRFWGEYCGALAKSPNGAWGTASGPTDQEARRITLRTCREYKGTNCSVLVSKCNTP